MLPDWLDADRLQWVLLAAASGLLYLMYVVARFVRRTIFKFLLFVLLVFFGFSLWVQRENLTQCAQTCSCQLYGEEVNLPRAVGGTTCDSLEAAPRR